MGGLKDKSNAPAIVAADRYQKWISSSPTLAIYDNETILKERKRLLKYWDSGSDCYCCGQKVKLYRISISSSQANVLIRFVKRHLKVEEKRRKEQWYSHHTIYNVLETGFPALARWELIESAPNTDQKKHSSGLWRPTQLGCDFAQGKTTVSKYVYMYNNRVWARSKMQVNIEKALNHKFDFRELWEAELEDGPHFQRSEVEVSEDEEWDDWET